MTSVLVRMDERAADLAYRRGSGLEKGGMRQMFDLIYTCEACLCCKKRLAVVSTGGKF